MEQTEAFEAWRDAERRADVAGKALWAKTDRGLEVSEVEIDEARALRGRAHVLLTQYLSIAERMGTASSFMELQNTAAPKTTSVLKSAAYGKRRWPAAPWAVPERHALPVDIWCARFVSELARQSPIWREEAKAIAQAVWRSHGQQGIWPENAAVRYVLGEISRL